MKPDPPVPDGKQFLEVVQGNTGKPTYPKPMFPVRLYRPEFLRQAGARLRERREELGLTREDIARLGKVSLQEVQAAELGSHALSKLTFFKVLDAVGLTADEVFA